LGGPVAEATTTVIKNGDFENGVDYSPWVCGDSAGIGINPPEYGSSGSYYGMVEVTGSGGMYISQDIAFAESDVTLEFDFNATLDGYWESEAELEANHDIFQVVLFNDTDSTTLFSYDIEYVGDLQYFHGPENDNHMSIDLTAFDLSMYWGEPATLSFELVDATSDYLYPLLAFDNVALHSARPVPEPATLLLIGMGLFGFGVRRRLKAL